jgi:cytochrome c
MIRVLALALLAAASPARAEEATGRAQQQHAEPVGPSEGDLELGRHLSSECVACHQLSGRWLGAVPPIVGYAPPAFVEAMLQYKTKLRTNETMRTVAEVLSDEEIKALAAYFGSVKPQP